MEQGTYKKTVNLKSIEIDILVLRRSTVIKLGESMT